MVVSFPNVMLTVVGACVVSRVWYSAITWLIVASMVAAFGSAAIEPSNVGTMVSEVWARACGARMSRETTSEPVRIGRMNGPPVSPGGSRRGDGMNGDRVAAG